jgi:hypothetical protein
MIKSGFGSLGSWFGYKQAPKAEEDPLQEESKDELLIGINESESAGVPNLEPSVDP